LEERLTPANFTVLNTADSGPGSLRAAVLAANNEAVNPGPDTIVFAPNLAGQTIGLTSGDSNYPGSALGVASTITIQGLTGSGGGVTISRGAGAPDMRLFGITTTGTLTLTNLTLTGGRAVGETGGEPGRGGAILNGGQLILQESTLSGNTALGGGSTLGTGGYGQGGAIDNYGSATIRDSTVSGNTAQGGDGDSGGHGQGGALYNSAGA
jgi:hypothetical protein